MSTRTFPKKRRFIVISSDEEGDSSPPPKLLRRAPLVSRETRSVSRNSSPGFNAFPSTPAARRPPSASSVIAPANSKLKSEPSVSKPKQTASPSITVPAKTGLRSYLSGSQHPPLSSTSSQFITPAPFASQHEDLDDLIEDIFSDDDDIVFSSANTSPSTKGSRPSTSTQRSHPTSGPNSRSGTNSDSLIRPLTKVRSSQKPQFKATQTSTNTQTRALLELRDPTFLTASLASNNTKIGTVVPDPLPWPERFAPRSSADLAVNPKKVSEVRSWLERVLDGFSKQRLLVLKGSAGSGKTTTVNVLSKELDFEVLEWKNPSSAIRGDAHGEEGAFSVGLAGIFEEFVGRAGKFGSLEMVSTSSTLPGAKPTQHSSYSNTGDMKRRIILIEDFPNTLFTSSPAPLVSFRHTIKSFLAVPPPPPTASPLPPLVLIVSESAIVTGPGAFTAHRLLSPDILNHPLAASITFNKIAPTFMLKALSAIITQESRESGRKFGPSKPLMEALASSGDVRSAIMGLEFLAVNGELGLFSERVIPTGRKKKKLGDGELNELEREMLMGVTQRESRFGIFHAVGKVVHNKRYGDDIEDPYVLPPPRPLLDYHPYKSRASRVDINSLMDEAGTDAQTLISGFHENYLGSCNFLGGFSRRTHSLEDLLGCVNSCIGVLSDSDILASLRPYHSTICAGRGGGHQGSEGVLGTIGIRQDEVSFQVAVRGIMMALPSPVKRDAKDNKMFYPVNLKLWREKEEIEGVVDLLIGKSRRSDDGYIGGCSVLGIGRPEMVLERLPYSKVILEGRQRKKAEKSSYGMKLLNMAGRTGGCTMRELEKVTVLRGICRPSEELPDEEATETLDELEAAEGREKKPCTGANDRVKAKLERKKEPKEAVEEFVIVGVENLVLSDDDIEDYW